MKPVSPGIAYRLLSLPLYPVWLLHAARQSLKQGLSSYWWMRMFCKSADCETPRIWVHAASTGEVRAVTPLVQALLQRGEKIFFTSFTASGYQTIVRQFAERVCSGVIPFDHPWHCRRFFRRQRIKLGLVMETELWPELLYQARNQGIELIQINARLSKKTLNAGGFLRRLLTTTLGYFTAILTRSERDHHDLLQFGANAERIKIIGNIKVYNTIGPAPSRLIDRDYLILASSHADEERQFLAARPASLKHCLLVIAPRHPSRSAAIQEQIEQLGLRCAVRSKTETIDQNTEVYLADTLGELRALLGFARVVIMGGSFDSTGGHNLLEPASLGCAIITGPSDSNISEDIKMLGPGSGLLQVTDMDACWHAIAELVEHPKRARSMGREAQARLAQQPDIIEQYLHVIEPWL